MPRKKTFWLLLVLVLVSIVLPIWLLLPDRSSTPTDPWEYVKAKKSKTDHTHLLKGPFASGSEVTVACLECHPDAARDIMQTSHWTWESKPFKVANRPEPIQLGKKNTINNFCIGIRSNWPPCTACHAGYGWSDANFDFSNQELVDCLVCHDRSGQYLKGDSGLPEKGVDLLASARSVGNPTRENCGGCHFRGGGGNAVKHGDLDGSLFYPSEDIDAHMGRHKFLCTDCHKTSRHDIRGRAFCTSLTDTGQIHCTDCHASDLHKDERINRHVASVGCPTCHVPYGAVKEGTKTHWDWSQAGQDLPEDEHEYLKIKGRFTWEKNIIPESRWSNCPSQHYLLGDPIDTAGVTELNHPNGDIRDPKARIMPFKIHRARQIYDAKFNYLIQPHTTGPEGYWNKFDWDTAARIGSEAVGLAYSGEFGFASTEMYWTLTHMVATKDKALQCTSCHGEGEKRLDWIQLGYSGDPMIHGSRKL